MIKIPLIGSDIRFDEVSIRAIRTFEFLDHVVDEIFDRIDARIQQNMTRINGINSRLEKASDKIERLKTSKKAIRMFSPARYPIEEPKKFKPTFDSTFQPGEVDFCYKLDLPLEPMDHKQYADKLQFFHLKTPKKDIPGPPSLIFNSTSISSLITFVNSENLYLKDASKAKEKELPVIESNTDDDTTDFSRFSTMIRTKQHGDNFHYLPSFNQAPDFEFPLDLPDLDGIAGDISFSVPDEELMEPTFRTLNIVNDLPNIAELMEVKQPQKIILDVVEPPAIPIDVPIAPPPPPPVPLNLIPVPPPPPIPAMAVPISAPAAPVPQVDNVRSSLMQAIREAGGKAKAKLKTVPAADEQPQPKPKQAPPAMDLMSELHKNLALRRKGIAGSKEAKKEKSSMMSRVSALIPPPPKKPPSSDDSATSESDENEEDWN